MASTGRHCYIFRIFPSKLSWDGCVNIITIITIMSIIMINNLQKFIVIFPYVFLICCSPLGDHRNTLQTTIGYLCCINFFVLYNWIFLCMGDLESPERGGVTAYKRNHPLEEVSLAGEWRPARTPEARLPSWPWGLSLWPTCPDQDSFPANLPQM